MATCECCGQPLSPYGCGGGGGEPISDELIEQLHKSYEVVEVSPDKRSYSAYNIVCVLCLESGCLKCNHLGKLLKK